MCNAISRLQKFSDCTEHILNVEGGMVSRTARDGLRVAVAGTRWTVYPSVASHVIHLVVGWRWSLCGEGGREEGSEEGSEEGGKGEGGGE